MNDFKPDKEVDEEEIYAAWLEARAAVEKGDVVRETAEEHIAYLKQDAASNNTT